MTAYKKEVYLTIALTILFLASGHIGLFFAIFAPNGVEGTFLGFPIHYIVPVIVGWFGVLFLTVVAGYIGNYLDEEIAKESDAQEKANVNDGSKPISMG
ncbi:hypothetical protein MFMK1_002099 [Metallumcola ferriviriculae]|uniref:Uncharacterized protein n=1 Tax=Metallumcola ferriviriculae TaxID=3039180 RepID=A0AAU0UPY0_9FIRM|nr:hypothetical protein MFMK1_002099 [Desulfitibacteraceae bacterium MK1]